MGTAIEDQKPWEKCGMTEEHYEACSSRGWTFDDLNNQYRVARESCHACEGEPMRYTCNGIPVGKLGCVLHPSTPAVTHFAKQGSVRGTNYG